MTVCARARVSLLIKNHRTTCASRRDRNSQIRIAWSARRRACTATTGRGDCQVRGLRHRGHNLPGLAPHSYIFPILLPRYLTRLDLDATPLAPAPPKKRKKKKEGARGGLVREARGEGRCGGEAWAPAAGERRVGWLLRLVRRCGWVGQCREGGLEFARGHGA